MILSFKCKDTERLFQDIFVKKWAAIERPARRKLEILDAAQDLKDLLAPPGNRLESLKGDRMGQYSIRINDQFRLCFEWTVSGAGNVEIVDYH